MRRKQKTKKKARIQKLCTEEENGEKKGKTNIADQDKQTKIKKTELKKRKAKNENIRTQK